MAKTLKQNVFLIIIGTFFILIGVGAILNSLYNGRPTQILWMCYISMIILGIGMIRKDNFIILSQLYILTIPVLIWNIDFVYYLITGNPFLGITDYFFEQTGLSLGKLISLQHLFTIPLAFLAVRMIGPVEPNAWNFSFIQVGIVFILSRFFTPEILNVNCVFSPCANVLGALPYYQWIWFFGSFIIIMVSAYVINRLPFLKRENL
ncbi:hypothetical protein HYT24_00825 [Candidatus Pacearchaeota archaeon]|nr:hypothetical protein [Candidatus Pacearchaeota archaeon]